MSTKPHSRIGMKAISAHRCGAGGDTSLENSREAVERAIAAGAEFLEFDVQLLGDGHCVVHHDSQIIINGSERSFASLGLDEARFMLPKLLTYEEMLLLLKGRAKAHIDYKFRSPQELYSTPELTYEVKATRFAIEVLGSSNMVVTTMEDDSVKAVRAVLGDKHPELLVGLSLGRSLDGMPLAEAKKIRMEELSPLPRLTACNANLLVINKKIYGPGVIAASHALSAPILLWTVDDDIEMWNYLTDPNIWLITSNYPTTIQDILAELNR